MEKIEQFADACQNNKVREVKKMISKGVDINGVNKYGYTGLALAMSNGNTEIARILLGCSNIKIDIKNDGRTALHEACYHNEAESVKLFLAHPACNKDIVTFEDIFGNKAEMIAGMLGYHECARLIREFITTVEEDTRDVDDLVEFITGDTEKKKRRKKRKTPVQSTTQSKNSGVSDDSNYKVLNNGVKGYHNATKITSKGEKEDLRNVESTKVKNLEKAKLGLEKKITSKHADFIANENNVKDIVDINSVEIKSLTSMITKTQDAKNIKLQELDNLDKEISELDIKMRKFIQRKTELLEESQNDEIMIED